MNGKRTRFTYIVPIPLGVLDRLDVADDFFAGKVMRTVGVVRTVGSLRDDIIA